MQEKKIMLGNHKLLAFGYSDILRGPQNLKNPPIFWQVMVKYQNDKGDFFPPILWLSQNRYLNFMSLEMKKSNMKIPLTSVCKFYNAMCRGYLFVLIPHISNEPMSGTLSTQPLDDPRKACHSNMSPGKQGKLWLEIWYFVS